MTSLLDLTSFENALQRFSEALQAYGNASDNTLYRDACIQRFEFSYELSHKMLKRYLELTSTNPKEIDALAFQNLIRSGNEQGLLLHDWQRWKEFRRARSITSHTYDEAKAMEIIVLLPDFLLEAQALLQELKKRSFILSTPPNIEISPEQWDIVSTILQKHIPDKTVWAFGSRATRKAKPYSDLDLAIISETPLTISLLATLEHEFTESDLPFKVDLVDWATTSANFRKIIEVQRVLLQ